MDDEGRDTKNACVFTDKTNRELIELYFTVTIHYFIYCLKEYNGLMPVAGTQSPFTILSPNF